MSNVEESYLDNLLKNVMEPHPVQPREREQEEEPVVEKTEVNLDELLESVEEEAVVEKPEVNLDELLESVEEEAVVEKPEVNLDELLESVEEEPVVEEPMVEEMPIEEMTELIQTDEPMIEEAEVNLDEQLESLEAEAMVEAPVVEESIMEELTMDEPKLEVPELESTDFSLDELDLDSLMADMPEVSQDSASEDSIDLAALEEMLGTESIDNNMDSESVVETSSSSEDELKLDEMDDNLLKDMGLFEENAGTSDSSGDEDDFGDVLSLLGDDDSDLAEINDLLKKSDNKEPVQDDMMDLLSQMADDEEKLFDESRQTKSEPESEELTTNMEEASVETKSGKKKKEKAAKKQKLDAEGKPIEKKPGLFTKLFNTLTEEFEPEPTEEELAKEAEEKAAAKQAAKAKKEEDKKAKAEENKVKAEEKEAAKKAKAEVAAQQKKEKQEAKAAKKAAKLAKEEAERPKNMVLVTIFAASVLAVVLLFTNFISEEGSLQRARKAYYDGNYQTVYVELYGSELEESDAIVQARSKVILKMQRKYDSYVNHMKMGQDVKALNALIEGLRTYDAVNLEAEQYGVMAEIDEIKTNILNVLDAKYGIDEATARELLQNEDEISYTKSLNHIIMGNSNDLVSNL